MIKFCGLAFCISVMCSVLRSVNLLSVTRFPGNIRGEGNDMKVKENNKCCAIYSLSSFCIV